MSLYRTGLGGPEGAVLGVMCRDAIAGDGLAGDGGTRVTALIAEPGLSMTMPRYGMFRGPGCCSV